MATRPAALLLQHIRKLAAANGAERSTDRELLERFNRERDEAAFTTLLRRHGPMVLRVAQRHLQQPADLEDVFQATFLLLVRKASGLHGKESVGNWLYGVAYRLALKTHRAAARRRTHESRARTRVPAEPPAEITLREAQALFDEALDQLPEKWRAPLVLCYLEGSTARGFVVGKQGADWHIFNRSHLNSPDAQANSMQMEPQLFNEIVSALQGAGVQNPVIH
jgi:RNA polymerase sigma factor (sigma-70 family)